MNNLNAFEDFVNSLGLVTCPRCGELCRVGEDGGEEARLLRWTNDISEGICGNCAVASWFQASPFAEMIDDPKKLFFEPLQKQFVEVMKAGNADMRPEEIKWELVVKHWDLPFPGQKKGRKRK